MEVCEHLVDLCGGKLHKEGWERPEGWVELHIIQERLVHD